MSYYAIVGPWSFVTTAELLCETKCYWNPPLSQKLDHQLSHKLFISQPHRLKWIWPWPPWRRAQHAPGSARQGPWPGTRPARDQSSPNRWEPVRFDRLPVRSGSGLGWYQIGSNSKFKFKFKKWNILKKIPKNTSRCDESNGIKFSQKFVHLV